MAVFYSNNEGRCLTVTTGSNPDWVCDCEEGYKGKRCEIQTCDGYGKCGRNGNYFKNRQLHKPG